MEPRTIAVKDLPRETKEAVLTDVSHYAVGLLRMYRDGAEKISQYIGSGTLVSLGDNLAVLTAGHVIRNFDDRGRGWDLSQEKYAEFVGMIIADYGHRFAFPRESLTFHGYYNLERSPKGPDFGLIILPHGGPELGQLRAKKSFYRLDSIDFFTSARCRVEKSHNFAVLVGAPDETRRINQGSGQFDKELSIESTVGFGGFQNYRSSGNSDLLDFAAVKDELYEGPVNFAGCSGGGIWDFDVEMSPDGRIISKRPILVGLPFYESPHSIERSTIIAHGPETIYRESLKLLAQ